MEETRTPARAHTPRLLRFRCRLLPQRSLLPGPPGTFQTSQPPGAALSIALSPQRAACDPLRRCRAGPGHGGQEVIWGKRGQGTRLAAAPSMRLGTRFYSWMNYLCKRCVFGFPTRASGRRGALRTPSHAGMLHGAGAPASHRDAHPTAGTPWIPPELGLTGTWVPSKRGAGHIPPCSPNPAKHSRWHQFSGAGGQADAAGAGKPLPAGAASPCSLSCLCGWEIIQG